MTDRDLTRAEVGALLDGTTPGPWRADGDPWNRIVWSSDDNRVCFMAHTNGLDDARDIATSNLVSAAPTLAAQLLRCMDERDAALASNRGLVRLNEATEARAEAAEAQLKAVLDREAETHRRHDAKVETLEAENARLRVIASHGADAVAALAKYDARAEAAEQRVATLEAENARLREAFGLLDKTAGEVARMGAVTGPQWTRLSSALLKGRAALATQEMKP